MRVYSPHFSRRIPLGRLGNSFVISPLLFLRLLVAKSPDVVMADTSSPFLALTALILHYVRGWRFVYLATELYPDIAVELGYVKRRHPLTKLWEFTNRKIYVGAARVVVIGERLKDVVSKYARAGTADEKITVIHNWADGHRIAPIAKESNPFCQEHQLTGKFVVLYSGTLGWSHNLDTFVLAADRLQELEDLRFVFIGHGAGWNHLSEMVKQRDLANVLVLPFQPEEIAPYSMACGDLSIVTLQPGVDRLTIPSKLYSSLAAGQGIIVMMGESTDSSDLVHKHAIGFRVSQGDVDTMVRELRRLYDDRQLLATMQQRARQTFDDYFGLERAIDEYVAVLCPR